MTSKRGKSKEVRYEPQASSVTDVLTTSFVRDQSTGPQKNEIYLLNRPDKTSQNLKNLKFEFYDDSL